MTVLAPGTAKSPEVRLQPVTLQMETPPLLSWFCDSTAVSSTAHTRRKTVFGPLSTMP